MPFSFARIARDLLNRSSEAPGEKGTSTRTKTLVTGTVALGAIVTGAVVEKTLRNRLPLPQQLPGALDADVLEMEIAESRVRYYRREGTGTPVVLLHSINAAASSFEMKPVFDHFAERTERPIYALDWLGFGISDRPPVRYSPGLYQRVLRRFLNSQVKSAADVVALSLASEYAATVANAYPSLINRLVFISPTGLSQTPDESVLQRAVVGVASTVGAFELFYARLTQKAALQSFFAGHIFSSPEKVPSGLVNYGYITSHARGAHHAPRRFIQGLLSMGEYAPRAYANLKTPTLFVIPETETELVQDFVRAPEIAAGNAENLRMVRVRSGLLPQWEAPGDLFATMDDFLDVPAPVQEAVAS